MAVDVPVDADPLNGDVHPIGDHRPDVDSSRGKAGLGSAPRLVDHVVDRLLEGIEILEKTVGDGTGGEGLCIQPQSGQRCAEPM